MARTPIPSAQTDAQRNGMTEAEWSALSPEARKWRAEHPDRRVRSNHALEGKPSAVAVTGDNKPTQGAQVELTGDAQLAARGGSHRSIVENTAARDGAIAAGHVAPGTSAKAVADTLAHSAGAAPQASPGDAPVDEERGADPDRGQPAG